MSTRSSRRRSSESGGRPGRQGSGARGRGPRSQAFPLRWLLAGLAVAVVGIIAVRLVLFGGVPGVLGTGEQAPDFTLSSATGSVVSLYDVLEEHDSVVLVFYRGFF